MLFLRIKILLILTITILNISNVLSGPIDSIKADNVDTSADNITTVPQVSSLDYQAINLLKNVNPNQLAKEYGNAMRGKTSWPICSLCYFVVGGIRLMPSTQAVQHLFTLVCGMGYEEFHVCRGLGQLFGNELIYVLVNSPLTNNEICSMVLGQECTKDKFYYKSDNKWKLKLEPLSDEVNNALIDIGKKSEKIQTADLKNISTILHLSDLHLDLYYQINSFANCREPLCCRSSSTPKKESFPAGNWGSMGYCDPPVRTFDNLLETISTQFSDQYRYVLLTGDYIPHDIWNTTREEILHVTKIITEQIKKYIPKDKIVIPTIGNHESHPVDQFCPSNLAPQFSTQWLYEELLNEWSDWIPEEYHETFRMYGYYAKVDGNKRFIVLNSNYGARLNFFNLLDYKDNGNMLNWLHNELINATLSKQMVYIVGHIAPDADECYTHWVATYRDFLETFKNVIRGQFFGHTHHDEIRIYYNTKQEPIGTAYLGPSVTTYLDVNPAFRFYTMDPDTGILLDHITHYLNISDANLNSKKFTPFQSYKPEWNFEYSARQSYNLPSLSAVDWYNFVKSLHHKDSFELMKKYYQHYGRFSTNIVERTAISTMINVMNKIHVIV